MPGNPSALGHLVEAQLKPERDARVRRPASRQARRLDFHQLCREAESAAGDPRGPAGHTADVTGSARNLFVLHNVTAIQEDIFRLGEELKHLHGWPGDDDGLFDNRHR